MKLFIVFFWACRPRALFVFPFCGLQKKRLQGSLIAKVKDGAGFYWCTLFKAKGGAELRYKIKKRLSIFRQFLGKP